MKTHPPSLATRIYDAILYRVDAEVTSEFNTVTAIFDTEGRLSLVSYQLREQLRPLALKRQWSTAVTDDGLWLKAFGEYFGIRLTLRLMTDEEIGSTYVSVRGEPGELVFIDMRNKNVGITHKRLVA